MVVGGAGTEEGIRQVIREGDRRMGEGLGVGTRGEGRRRVREREIRGIQCEQRCERENVKI